MLGLFAFWLVLIFWLRGVQRRNLQFLGVVSSFSSITELTRLFPSPILSKHQVKIYVRRAGPNYQEGLQLMRNCSNETGLDIKIYGPETHVTAIVPLALGLEKLEDWPEFDDDSHIPRTKKRKADDGGGESSSKQTLVAQKADHEADHKVENFTAKTRCVVYGLQHRAVQGMLDFDHMCKREQPSVAAMIFPFAANHFVKVRIA